MNTFESLRTNQRVAVSAVGIPLRCTSVIFKLQSAKQHLDNIRGIKDWIVASATTLNVASGVTIATGSASVSSPAVQWTSPTAYQISMNMDDFFSNLSSVFEYFSQIINLTYFAQPLLEANVTFNRIAIEMGTSKIGDSMTIYLSTLRRQKWFINLNLYRRCAIHRKIILCQVDTVQSLTQTSPYSLKSIVLPDNPFDDKPTYHQNRDMNFVESMFRDMLGALDRAFAMMENKMRTANQIPI